MRDGLSKISDFTSNLPINPPHLVTIRYFVRISDDLVLYHVFFKLFTSEFSFSYNLGDDLSKKFEDCIAEADSWNPRCYNALTLHDILTEIEKLA